MRRWLCGWIWMICVCVSGCDRAVVAPLPPYTDAFTCAVDATYRDMTVKGTLTRESPTALSLTLTKPESLNGLTARWADGTLTATMYGVSTHIDTAQCPQVGLIPLLMEVLDTADVQTDITVTDEGAVLRGETDAGAYTLITDPASGYLRSLSMPDIPLTAAFSDVRPLG